MKLIKIVVVNFVKTNKSFYNVYKLEFIGFKKSTVCSLGNILRNSLLEDLV